MLSENLEPIFQDKMMEAFKKGDLDEVTRIAVLRQKAKSFLEQMEKELNDTSKPSSAPVHVQMTEALSKKAQGKLTRDVWIAQRKKEGIDLICEKGIVFRTKSNERVAIATATESKTKLGEYWLGVPDKSYDFIVLLCTNANGMVMDPVLPSYFFKPVWKKLSCDNAGQVKFNVRVKTTGTSLLVPTSGWVSISEWINKYGQLK